MDSLFKRILAYLIDMLLVSIVVNSIVSSKVINVQLDKYKSIYKEYQELFIRYDEQTKNDINNCKDLEKAIAGKKISEKDYVDEYDKLDKNNKDEYEAKCSTIVDKYNKNKIEKAEFVERVNDFYYHMERNSTINYLVNIMICLLYFVVFQGFTKGQTLGKKIMRLKVVSTTGKDLTYVQLLIRTIFLYSIIYSFMMMTFVYVIPVKYFTEFSNIVYTLNYILTLAVLLMIVFNRDRKGLHDVIAKTRVMMMDFKGNEIRDNSLFKKKEKILKKENQKGSKK